MKPRVSKAKKSNCCVCNKAKGYKNSYLGEKSVFACPKCLDNRRSYL